MRSLIRRDRPSVQPAGHGGRAQSTQICARGSATPGSRDPRRIGGYLCPATDQRQLQNVTGSPGPHGGLRGLHAAVTSGYHLGKRHWNTVTLDGSIPGAEVLELIGHAYDLVVAHLTTALRSKLIT